MPFRFYDYERLNRAAGRLREERWKKQLPIESFAAAEDSGKNGEQPPAVGGRGDHRRGTQPPAQQQGQGVGAADVARDQWDGKAAVFIQAEHGRVLGLVPQMGGHRPHRDACRPHEDQGLALGKGLCRPLGQGDPLPAAPPGAALPTRLLQHCLGPFRQGHAPAGKGDQPGSHWLFPWRYSVVKAGS